MKRKHLQKSGFYSSFQIKADAPVCPHGTKLYVEPKSGGKSYYVCSAFRNASACRKDNELYGRLKQFVDNRSLVDKAVPEKRRYCQNCCMLFTGSTDEHTNHRVKSHISDSQLAVPSYLLDPLEKSSEHAQYFFSNDWLHFMVSTFRTLQIENLICVGAPRLFDYLTLTSRKDKESSPIKRFLLDLDTRLGMFYSSDKFARFNAMNGHFFTFKEEAKANDFMKSVSGRSVIFCDPPFGALMEPLVATLNNLKGKLLNSDVFLMITVPYFIGRKLLQAAPYLKMLDYKVTYENHIRFMSTGHDGNNAKRRISVVRLFTDAPASEIPPPEGVADQFWFCETCQSTVRRISIACPAIFADLRDTSTARNVTGAFCRTTLKFTRAVNKHLSRNPSGRNFTDNKLLLTKQAWSFIESQKIHLTGWTFPSTFENFSLSVRMVKG